MKCKNPIDVQVFSTFMYMYVCVCVCVCVCVYIYIYIYIYIYNSQHLYIITLCKCTCKLHMCRARYRKVVAESVHIIECSEFLVFRVLFFNFLSCTLSFSK